MPSIGDIANDIAHAMYELRIPVAIGSIAALSVAIVVARRLGWFTAARRHPRRTASIVAVLLAVTAPVGWYLGSPIFIRTSLVEAEAAVVAASRSPRLTSPPAPSAVASASPTAPPSPSPTPFVPSTVRTGAFHGTDDFHFGRGTASIVETEPGRFRLRLDDFSVRNGPDLYVYLSPSPDGYAADAVELGKLKATDGSFGYDLPAGLDRTRFESAIIWCKQFSHLFAVAPFDR
jgi:hypothetical protein